MDHMTQRYILDRPEAASPVLPMHVALTTPEGGAVLGELAPLGAGATLGQLAASYDGLVLALVSAGLASPPAGAGGAAGFDAAGDEPPTEGQTKDEIAEWAVAHGIDLAGCRTKADQLSVIAAETSAGA